MRRLASFLLCCFALCAGAAEVWRGRDANGNVRYADSPFPGAERIDVRVVQPRSPTGGEPPVVLPPPPSSSGPAAPASPDAVRYTRCAVMQPANDTTLQWSDPVMVTLAIEPALQFGHRIQVLVNGAVRADWPAASASASLGMMSRGSYTLAARVVDASGLTLCSGEASAFHVRQPSLLSPLRRPAPN